MPTVLPESLLELLPPPPAVSSPTEQALVLIGATERLLRSLGTSLPNWEAVEGQDAFLEVAASADALADMKRRLNNPYDGEPQIERLVLSFKNELSAKGALISAIVEKKHAKGHPTDRRQQAERATLSSLRLEQLRAEAKAQGLSRQEVLELLGVMKHSGSRREGSFGGAADARDIETLVTCPHTFFSELGLARLYATRQQLVDRGGEKKGALEALEKTDAAWASWCAKVATVQVRHGADLWQNFRERLELVGETAHFLYAEPGKALKHAYAQPGEEEMELEFQDLEEAKEAEEAAMQVPHTPL